jgi:TolB protein
MQNVWSKGQKCPGRRTFYYHRIITVMRTLSQKIGFALFVFLPFALMSGCAPQEATSEYDAASDSLRFDEEVHLRNIKQLTFGGNNAEAYWSFDDEKIIFQSDWTEINDQGCDQIYVMDPDVPGEYKLVSTGMGRTTCSYFLTDGRIMFGSTHSDSKECPAPVAYEQGRYVWPIYDSYDIYVADADGSNIDLLIGGEGYDAEATASPDGKWIIFTSTRSGDLELWRYEMATGDLLQLTDGLGYDGGAFFSPDSKHIVWRASRPEGEAAEVYMSLLKDGLVEPSALNIFVAEIDGSNPRQITDLPGANWAPFFHPSGEKIIFTTNHHQDDGRGRVFDLFMINLDGTGLEQITFSGTFDGFPMFSNDGKKIAFASNRNVSRTDSRDTNVFIADWIE